MRIVLILALGVLAACSPAEAPAPAGDVAAPVTASVTPASAAPGEGAAFMAPSGNMGCNYTPAGGTAVYETADGGAELSCDRIEPSYVRIVMSERGAPALIENVGDAGCCGGEALAYGTPWSAGPFACDMSEAGLVCTNAGGHGFTLSRTQAQVR